MRRLIRFPRPAFRLPRQRREYAPFGHYDPHYCPVCHLWKSSPPDGGVERVNLPDGEERLVHLVGRCSHCGNRMVRARRAVA